MYKILLVEDERSMRLGLEHVLKRAGHAVRAVDTVGEGVRCLQNEVFDVVVTDMRLPDDDGMAVLRQVKECSPDTGVIIITAFAEVKSAVKAIQQGAYDYLSKPLEPDELPLVIDRFLRHKELACENSRLKEEILQCRYFEEIISASSSMELLFEKIRAVAPTDSTVLICGESGTGKELVANAVHNLSPRRSKPFIKINCPAVPETLIEAELFGHEKGAFTGAQQRRKGKFEAAHGGTVFLDEIGDMPLSLQAKLLRVIETRSFERLGSNETVRVDIRFLCATAKDLNEEKETGRFRADLYYRLNVLPIVVPPLRNRKEDIPLLVDYFIERIRKKTDNRDLNVSPAAMNLFVAYDYPGNVRELKHAVEMAATFCRNGTIEPWILPETLQRAGDGSEEASALPDGTIPFPDRVRNFERELLVKVLRETGGRKLEAAKKLGISRGTLWRRLQKHGFDAVDEWSDV